MKKIILLLILIMTNRSYADLNPGWTVNAGGTTGDLAYEQFMDNQGNIYLTGAVDGTGAVQNFGGYFCGTIKISNSGTLQWFKRWNFSGPDSTNEFGNGLAVDNSGNVFVGVNSWGNAALISLSHILKYDGSGNLLWTAELKSGHPKEFINCITIDNDGNIYAAGRAGGQAFLSKISGSSGDSLWTLKTNLGYEVYEIVHKDGFIYAAGTEAKIVKVSTSGNITWAADMNVDFTAGDYGIPLFVDDNGYSYTTGLTVVNNDNSTTIQYTTVKINPDGSIAWEKVLPPTAGTFDFNYGYAVTADPSGNVYSTGQNGGKFVTMKLSSSTGDILWKDSSANGSGKAIIYKDGSVISAGSRGGFGIVEYNAGNGNIIQSLTPSGGTAIEISVLGNKLYIGGESSDFYCTEITHIPLVGINPISSGIPEAFSLKQNYPNPFNPVTRINFSITESNNTSLIVYDILGKEVRTIIDGNLQAGTYSVDFDAAGLTSGIYFYRLSSGDYSDIKKMTLIK